MFRFIAKRFLEAIPVLLVVSAITFVLLRIAPGGPFDTEKATSPEIRAQIEAYYGLNRKLWRQYTDYMWRAAHGDLGPSYKYIGWDVRELIADSLPVSMELGCYALAFALVVGLITGAVASLRPNTWTDYLPMSIATLGICLPTFVTGPLLILVFGIMLHWYNSSGWFFASDRVLPSITLGLFYTAYLSRLARGGMLEILSQDYIRTARAKGASEWRVLWKHAWRGGLLSVVAYLGPAVSGLLTGSLVVETIFDIPGAGRFFVNAASSRDYTMVMGTTLIFAVLVIGANLVVDILQVWLNPKLRFD